MSLRGEDDWTKMIQQATLAEFYRKSAEPDNIMNALEAPMFGQSNSFNLSNFL